MFGLGEVLSIAGEAGSKEADAGPIEFVCPPEYEGIIPEPSPAHNELPEWYKEMPLERDGGSERKQLRNSTVKACVPFLEAMKLGWIVKLPADLQLEVGGGEVNAGWRTDRELFSMFSKEMMQGASLPGPIMKFHLFWHMRVPEGYSVLVTSPMNNPNPMFRTFSGIISADNYTGEITPPSLWLGGEWEGVLEQGTPVAQVIPFRRDGVITEAEVGAMTNEEVERVESESRHINTSQRAYRESMWEPIDGASNTYRE